MKITFNTLILLIALLLTASCAGSSPDPIGGDLSAERPAALNSNNTQLWGYYDISFDTQTNTVEAVPLRTAMFTANVSKFIDGPPPLLTLNINNFQPGPEFTDIELDIGIIHPFPGFDSFTGFDVIGVFLGDGSEIYPGDSTFTYGGANDQRLMNPDGYTRWFNAIEFGNVGVPLFAYQQTSLGSKDYIPSANINGYKYFADGLHGDESAFDFLMANPDTRGKFSPGESNGRIFQLRWPDEKKFKFQYAVIAHWEPNVNHPNPPMSLDDFPANANADESLNISVTDNSDLWWESVTTWGGDLNANITVFDWSIDESVVSNEFEVRLLSDAWTGYKTAGAMVDSGDNWTTFNADFQPDTLTSADPLDVWIEVVFQIYDYSNPFGAQNDAEGPLTSYFRTSIDVDDTGPAEPFLHIIVPNGGESFQVSTSNDILWDYDPLITNVRLDYSVDGGVTFPGIITDSTPCDGAFSWIVPDTPTTEARVRVQDIDDPGVSDQSDENFSIIKPSGDGPWVYGFADYNFFTDLEDSDNDILFENMLNLPLTGPYAGNKIVKWYWGHADDFGPDWTPLDTFLPPLGYEFVVDGDPILDVTGVKLLIISFMFPSDSDPIFSPEEVQTIKDFVNGGGICILMFDNSAVMSTHYNVIDTLCADLGIGFTPRHEVNADDPFTDISPDPITENVGIINCDHVGGTWLLTGENAVSLVRETGTGEHSIVKSTPGD